MRIYILALILIIAAPALAPADARADLADQRTEELLKQLQAGRFEQAEQHFDSRARAELPPDKLATVWRQLTAELGALETFKIIERNSLGSSAMRTADLTFEHASGWIAQVGLNASGEIVSLFFRPGPQAASREAGKRGDRNIDEMMAALRDRRFDAATNHFDAAMKSALTPAQLADAWRQRTASLGALKSWRIASRTDVGGIQVCVVNLEFEKQSKPFALKIAIDPSLDVGGLYFVAPVADSSSAAPDYIHPSEFRSEQLTVGGGLGATLTIPLGAGPFPAALLVQGSGPHDRDETVAANRPFKDIAEGLSSSGIAVLRYDKRTFAKPASLNLTAVTVATEVIDDAVAAAHTLAAHRGVERSRVFVVGHSLGALVAPEIAQRAKLAGAILLAPPGRPLAQTMVDQERYLGADPSKVAADENAANLILTKSMPPATFFNGAPASYFYDLESRDEPAVARKLNRPILILRGERDYQVTDADIAVWRKALSGARGVTIRTLPGLNHLFIRGSGKAGPDEYMSAGHVDSDVIAALAAFIKG